MEIRIADEDDIGPIQQFLDDNWKRGYILATNRAFFEWQFRSRHERRVNFVIAKKADGEVMGTLGFIPSNHHGSSQRKQPPFLWLTNWMVVRGNVPPGLGIMLRRFLERNVDHCGIGTIGLNQATLDLYRRFGYVTGEMDHHVLVNGFQRSFNLLKTKGRPGRRKANGQGVEIRDKTENWDGVLPGRPPEYLFKSADYYRNRYLNHPVYHYRCLSMENDFQRLLLFVRRQDKGGGSCLRIVEARGDLDLLESGTASLQDLMRREGVEYMDLISKHVEDRVSLDSWQDGRSLEVPNYFEPYQPGFVTLRYAIKMKPGEELPFLFKGDCDQDAPRSLKPS